MTPKQIKASKGSLCIIWNDDSQWEFPIKTLRDECPCAGCKGETILLRTYSPENKAKTEESYKIASIQPVGGYAISINWKDGHDSGIYSWEYLQALRKKITEQ